MSSPEPVFQARGIIKRFGHVTALSGTDFDLYPGEVLGVVALDGQGQDELFDILAGSDRASGGEMLVDGTAVSFRHPADGRDMSFEVPLPDDIAALVERLRRRTP